MTLNEYIKELQELAKDKKLANAELIVREDDEGNGYRQYDPVVGRYLTPDPMGTVDGLNPYLYVGNNPLNKVDPYGLYQTDMHYYMTYFLAITAGIDSDNARRIALATQFV